MEQPTLARGGNVNGAKLSSGESDDVTKTKLKAFVESGGLTRTRRVGEKTAAELAKWCGATVSPTVRVLTVRRQRGRRPNAEKLLIQAARTVSGIIRNDISAARVVLEFSDRGDAQTFYLAICKLKPALRC